MTTRSHLLLSLLGAALLTLAWPATGSLAPLLLFGLAPFFWILEQRSKGHWTTWRKGTLWILFLGLAVWNLITTSWLGDVQEGWETRLLLGVGVMLANAGLMLLPFGISMRIRRTAGPAWAWAAFVALWLSGEWAHMRWDLQWPWLTLGNGFASRPEWVQWYEVTGHLGGSLWVLLSNLFVLRVLLAWQKNEGSALARRKALSAVAMILVPIAISWLRYTTWEERGPAIEVVVVQPNIDPYSEKFGGVDPLAQLEDMLTQADAVMTDTTRLVLMPETALQEPAGLYFEDDGSLVLKGLWENDIDASGSVGHIRTWLKKHPAATVLTGMSSSRLFRNGETPSVTARPVRNSDTWFDAANSALFVSTSPPAGVYHKSKLVAGVELLPFEQLLGSLEALSIDMGGTTGSLAQQSERECFSPVDRAFSAAPVICYESVFGDYVADYVRQGADLITIITNDAWWGNTAGYRQHLAYARLRAIETRRAVARSANTGISCSINQRGDVSQATEWWVPTAIRCSVRLNREISPFVRFGEWIAQIALLAGACSLLAAGMITWRTRRRRII
ncbi:MAG: apolipoprotein N-acyltransferase [Flavobacteriales bacterium]|nr:apolipoprotein N-acyltransferase [Flavobacteriales bacterium]MBK6753917.1 apolipoprotein N-acyltransferase [Flavobacteriales bacterium]MBK7751725.1 apolipoprotein N-acyltransferase [Flavobacteriales bacterium]MBK9076461.1 apolipoprotein N-acyltransferase [Flavobacteriales bacterium]MBK9539519.1 apolipoprotein N-acyltransferase [Flavobacteriales bacterium]